MVSASRLLEPFERCATVSSLFLFRQLGLVFVDCFLPITVHRVWHNDEARSEFCAFAIDLGRPVRDRFAGEIIVEVVEIVAD
jgi:hypothetical protein